MYNITTLDGEVDESKEVVYLWEVGDGFVRLINDRDSRLSAKDCETLAREESHQFCYIIPGLEIGGSIARLESISDSLENLASTYNCELQLFATSSFSEKFRVDLATLKHLRSTISKLRN